MNIPNTAIDQMLDAESRKEKVDWRKWQPVREVPTPEKTQYIKKQ